VKYSLALAVLLISLLTACNGDPENTETSVLISFPGEFGDSFAEQLIGPATLDAADLARGYRQQTMRQLSSAYRAMEWILRYNAPFDLHLDEQASTLLAVSQRLDDVFQLPDPATEGQSGARPEIWSEPERFGRHIGGIQREAAGMVELMESTESRQARLSQLDSIRHQCLACHQAFRWR